MNATAAAKAVRPNNGMAVLHTDELLRKHELLLKQVGTKWFLIDWRDIEKPVSKERALAYLTDLASHPGFPGPEVAAQLQKSQRSPKHLKAHPKACKVIQFPGPQMTAKQKSGAARNEPGPTARIIEFPGPRLRQGAITFPAADGVIRHPEYEQEGVSKAGSRQK